MKDFFERYAARIDRGPGCWLWTGASAAGGYGHSHRDGRHFYAHRAAYEAMHGDGTADGMVVRHKCDNPPCVNPSHLEVGTHADNARDCLRRGRARRAVGEAAPTAKLTAAAVQEARRLYVSGVIVARLIERWPVKHDTMAKAVRGQTWRHLSAEACDGR